MKNCFVESCLILICSIFSSPPYRVESEEWYHGKYCIGILRQRIGCLHKLLVLKYQPIPNPQSNSQNPKAPLTGNPRFIHQETRCHARYGPWKVFSKFCCCRPTEVFYETVSTKCTGDKSSFLSTSHHRSQYAKVYTRPSQAQDSEGDRGCPQWGEAAAGLRFDHRTGRGSGRRTADGGRRHRGCGRPLELVLVVAAGWVRPRLAQNTCRPTQAQAPGLQPLLAPCSHTGSPGLVPQID